MSQGYMSIKGYHLCDYALGWRSRDQLMVMYNGNSEVVNAITRRKTQLGLCRDHPDMPGDETMRLYYVPDLNVSSENICYIFHASTL